MYHSRWLYDYNIKYLNVIDKKMLSFYFKVSEHIGTVCMVFFFFASAFWFYRNLKDNKDVIKKWKKRLKTLLIPFLLWTIIIAIYEVCNFEITITAGNWFYYLFESPVAGPLWYILGLLILQLFAPLVVLIKKEKKLVTCIFLIIIIYVLLRNFGVIPHLLTFKNWWWYNNLIIYLPIYILGAYVGMYYPNLLLDKEYDGKKYSYIGILLMVLSFVFWHYFKDIKVNLTLIYSLIELIGIWFLLKPSLCYKDIPELFKCNFYIFALHNPILIPKTQIYIVKLFSNVLFSGIGVIVIKILQLLIIILVCTILRFIICKILPTMDKYLTGGR